jgi:hypothetical protein
MKDIRKVHQIAWAQSDLPVIVFAVPSRPVPSRPAALRLGRTAHLTRLRPLCRCPL